MFVTGYLWGEEKENWLMTYSAQGKFGDEPVRLYGKVSWPYNEKVADHTDFDFQQTTKFGEHSVWGWVIGSETVVGGTIVAGGAIATAEIVTSGLATITAGWIGAAGFVTGSTALLGASAAVKELLKSDSPPPPPPTPVRPNVPKGKKLSPSKGAIYTGVSYDGFITGSFDEALFISGKFDGNTASGVVKSVSP